MARDVNETTTRKMFGFGISNADVDDFAFFWYLCQELKNTYVAADTEAVTSSRRSCSFSGHWLCDSVTLTQDFQYDAQDLIKAPVVWLYISITLNLLEFVVGPDILIK
jgi:hypothetical protein